MAEETDDPLNVKFWEKWEDELAKNIFGEQEKPEEKEEEEE